MGADLESWSIDEIETGIRDAGLSFRRMGTWRRIVPCPLCRSASREPMGINTETGGYICHKCGQTGHISQLLEELGLNIGDRIEESAIPEKKKKPPKMPLIEDITAATAKLFDNQAWVDSFNSNRGISDRSLRDFRVGVVERKGEVFQQIPYSRKGKQTYNKIKRSYTDENGKRQKTIIREPRGAESHLFSIDNCIGKKKIVVVEGEEDAIVLAQSGVRNVVSLPDGAHASYKTRKPWLDDLEKFEEIVICLDADTAGRKGADALAEVLGRTRCRIVEYPLIYTADGKTQLKDACEFAAAGHLAELARAISLAPEEDHPLVSHVASEEAIDELREDHEGAAPHGFTTGWECFDSLIGGVRAGELTVLTGHTGSGKSAFGTCLLVQLAALGVPVMGASFENSPLDFRWRILQRIVGKYPHIRPDGSGLAMSKSEREQGLQILKELPLHVVNQFGSMDTAEFIKICEYGKRRLGVKFILLDHLHFMTQGALDRERFVLAESIHALKQAATSLEMAIWVVCHPSRNARDKKNPEATDLHGSAALEQVADNVVAVQRIEPEGPNQRMMANIHLLKLRRGRSGRLGSCPMFFDPSSEALIDPSSELVRIGSAPEENEVGEF